MLKGALLSLLLCVGVPAEAQILVKRSDLWAYELNDRVKQNLEEAKMHGADHVRYMRDREAQEQSLQQRLNACGNCVDRARLTEQLRQLRTDNREYDELICGSIEMQKDFNPAVAPIAKALGFGSFCEKVMAQREAELDRQEKERFMQRMRAGDLIAYQQWGQRLFNERQLPFHQRLSNACPWFYQGAKKGDPGSTASLANNCLGPSSNDADRRDGVDILRACANRGEVICIRQLAWFYSPIRDSNWPPPLPANEQEALRLFDLAASKGDAIGADEARRLRGKIERETRAGAGLPPKP